MVSCGQTEIKERIRWIKRERERGGEREKEIGADGQFDNRGLTMCCASKILSEKMDSE